MGRRARERKAARDLVRHMVEKQVLPYVYAGEARQRGVNVDVELVSTDMNSEGYTVTCSVCGRSAKMLTDPGTKVGLCPNCIPRES